MNLLIDSHVLYAAAFAPDRLPRSVETMLTAQENTILVSAISPYELEWKRTIGKLAFPAVADWRSALARNDFALLDVGVEHGVAAARLPIHHRDPWDRLLIAQAMLENMPLVTNDRAIAAYGVATIW